MRRLYGDRRLWLTVMGISYFWLLGAVLQIAILLFGIEVLGADELGISILVTFLAVGIGMGSLIGGRLSGDKVELGLVPLGAVGMGGFAILLASSDQSYNLAAGVMALLGFSAGCFIVPLEAFLQQRSGRQERGRILAAKSFLTTGAILLASLLSWVLRDLLDIPPDRIILIFGIFTLLSTVYVLKICARLSDSIRPVAIYTYGLQDPHRGTGARTVSRLGVAGLQPPFFGGRFFGGSLSPTLHPFPRLPPLLRYEGVSLDP